MDMKLCITTIVRVLLGFILFLALIFIPAGSAEYWQGLLLIGILFVPMIIGGAVLMVRNPEMLRKRMNMRETEMKQKIVVALSGLIFAACFILSGLGFRFGWYMFPAWVSYFAAVLFLISYALYAEVIRENEYLSRTVEIQEGQKVIDTGLYGIVRHPMYMSTVILFLSMPLVLGSPAAFLIMLFYIPVIVMRIRNEEKVLEKGLPGYTEYEKKVKHRLIPFIW